MNHLETVYFAGGCFWCITPTFREMEGVYGVISGYSGGDEVNPSYEDVKSQKTSHRETIRVDYDPCIVSFEKLFDIFLASVNPFDPDGQFIDRGHSYTLAVYYLNETQKRISLEGIRRLEEAEEMQAFIAVEPFKSFYPAEEYHQDYDRKNPEAFRRELIDSGRIRPEE